jgi:hypothetical protein
MVMEPFTAKGAMEKESTASLAVKQRCYEGVSKHFLLSLAQPRRLFRRNKRCFPQLFTQRHVIFSCMPRGDVPWVIGARMSRAR